MVPSWQCFRKDLEGGEARQVLSPVHMDLGLWSVVGEVFIKSQQEAEGSEVRIPLLRKQYSW